ncbi:DUF4203 domain-containing protein, partial [bacterium]|nr:DUF4203 domain-containing protein [candidate division CSSED10-310 bacterium]
MNSDAVVLLVLGIVLAFLGYPVYRLSLKIAGFIMGFFVGLTVVHFIDRYLVDLPYDTYCIAAGGLLLGLLGAMNMHRWVKVMLFVTGFSLGMVIARGSFAGQELFAAIPSLHQINAWVPGIDLLAILLAIVLGVVAILLEKFFIILFTSFWGARLISSHVVNPYIFPAVLFIGILF